MTVVHEAANLLLDTEHGSTEFIPLALVLPAVDCITPALDLVVRMAQAVDTRDVILTPLDRQSAWIVAGHERAYAWIQSDNSRTSHLLRFSKNGALVLGPYLKRSRDAQVELTEAIH